MSPFTDDIGDFDLDLDGEASGSSSALNPEFKNGEQSLGSKTSLGGDMATLALVTRDFCIRNCDFSSSSVVVEWNVDSFAVIKLVVLPTSLSTDVIGVFEMDLDGESLGASIALDLEFKRGGKSSGSTFGTGSSKGSLIPIVSRDFAFLDFDFFLCPFLLVDLTVALCVDNELGLRSTASVIGAAGDFDREGEAFGFSIALDPECRREGGRSSASRTDTCGKTWSLPLVL